MSYFLPHASSKCIKKTNLPVISSLVCQSGGWQRSPVTKRGSFTSTFEEYAEDAGAVFSCKQWPNKIGIDVVMCMQVGKGGLNRNDVYIYIAVVGCVFCVQHSKQLQHAGQRLADDVGVLYCIWLLGKDPRRGFIKISIMNLLGASKFRNKWRVITALRFYPVYLTDWNSRPSHTVSPVLLMFDSTFVEKQSWSLEKRHSTHKESTFKKCKGSILRASNSPGRKKWRLILKIDHSRSVSPWAKFDLRSLHHLSKQQSYTHQNKHGQPQGDVIPTCPH